jgi:deoxyadenosine/deoxycytidine kinase
MSSPNYQILSIEGNIGGGKSTLLESLKRYYENDKTVLFVDEPVKEWEKIKDDSGNTMLKKFYADQKKYAFPFQMMAYVSRLKMLRDIIKSVSSEPDKHFIIITERSLFTDKYVFAKMLFDQGQIEDVCYQIYLTWFDEFAKDFPIANTVYVKTYPQICYDRIHLRAREGEEIIPLTYLKECHNYHEYFLDEKNGITVKKIVLDGNVDIFKNKQILEEWLSQINILFNK